ncbi:MAG: GHKL domain-containing protein [Planctomycetes bacterium]|nr:GHKL domain-containing protein [Planctomycetota bacterium]
MTTERSMNRRILIIDDNQSIHEDFRAILAPDNQSLVDMHEEEAAIFGDTTASPIGETFEVDGAFQGEEALAMARTALDEGRPYALAFVDMRMPPGWDGVTTIEKLWEVCPDLETAICTAFSDHDWNSIMERLGTTSQLLILKKPYDNIEILQLATALTEKWNLAYEARHRETLLENLVSERMAELATINTELKQFAYIVSHDLKAPLRGIQSLADWVVIDYADKLDAPGVEQLHLIQTRAERMHNLIEGILRYSRVGCIEGQKTPVDLHTIVSEVTDLLNLPTHITITIDNPLPTIEIEETQIFQVFLNLLSNAVNYLDKPRGTIHIGCQEQEDAWLFSVKDNGPGIDAKCFELIFQLFQKLNNSDDHEGTGIGLNLVKKIIENQDGKIWVESEVGTGSTFWFTLKKELIHAGT